MVKYFYCEDINIIKKEVGYDSTFLDIVFDTSNLLMTINTTDLFNPINKYFIRIEEFDLEDILFAHKNINDFDKEIYFILPNELSTSMSEKFILNSLEYQKINFNEISTLNYLKQYNADNNISIEDLALIRISESYDNINFCINEINKLHAFCYPSTISLDDVKRIATKNDYHNIFDLIDLYLSGQNTKAIELFTSLSETSYTELALVEVLYSQVRFLIQLQALRNNSSASIASILKVKEYRIKKGINTINKNSRSNLCKLLNNLAEIDYKYKSGYGDMNNIKVDLIII